MASNKNITNYITFSPQIVYKLIEAGRSKDILEVQGLSIDGLNSSIWNNGMFLLQSKHHNHSNVQTSRIYSMESQIELQVRLRASVVRLALVKFFPRRK